MGSDNERLLERFRATMDGSGMEAMSRLVDEATTDDFVQEWPQSGERLDRAASKKVGESYEASTGTRPKFTHRRTLVEGDLAVEEGTIDYGDGTPVSYVAVIEFRDGKVARTTEYFANPFPAPEWRKELVEQMDQEPAAV